MAAITVENVTKEFRLGQITNIRQALGRSLSRMRGQVPSIRPLFKALDNVNFQVQEGEVLGIIGSNGAGKSTVLKMLARISTPTSGRVIVHGKIAPLIEVGAGLISDLSGRENIYLNGIILGMPYSQIRKKFDEIVAFAELEEFIDTPLKRYSSGMAVRLGFSIATCVDADILIVDEVLAVGDLAFQRKCFDRMEDMIKRQGKTVILVSHNTRQIERLCTRVILMDHGRIVEDGPASKVCDLFYERSDEKIKLASARGNAARWTNTMQSDDVEILDVSMHDGGGDMAEVVEYKSEVAIRIRFAAHGRIKVPVFLIGVHTTDFIYVTRNLSDRQIKLEELAPGRYEVVCTINQIPLLPGIYAVLFAVGEGLATRWLFYAENMIHLQVKNNAADPIVGEDRGGFIAFDAAWTGPRPISLGVTPNGEMHRSVSEPLMQPASGGQA
jgi:homopolymeric O-antigen transport system ATP-binding protein